MARMVNKHGDKSLPCSSETAFMLYAHTKKERLSHQKTSIVMLENIVVHGRVREPKKLIRNLFHHYARENCTQSRDFSQVMELVLWI